MRILNLNHIAIHVIDLDTSIRFYEQLLNEEVIPRPAFGFSGAWFQLGSGQELHLIGGRTDEVNSRSRGTHFALEVEDIRSTARELEDRGINYDRIRQRPDGARQIFLFDPDGYCIELCETASK